MRNLIEFLVLHLVQHPDAVQVHESEVDGRFEYVIEVHPEDRGHVIGRHGRTIEAIRTLVKVRAMKEGQGVRVSVASDDEPAEESEDSAN